MSEDALSDMLRRDPRYPRAAYEFVRDALQFTVERAGAQRHVTAKELLEGIRDHAREEFGPLARMVFESWNVHQTQDFGNLVFNLVEAGEMGKTDEDDIRDFDSVYRFEEAFPRETGPVEVRRPGEDEDD
jgi:uncharacterized repeat protein (TIGR04138 family)